MESFLNRFRTITILLLVIFSQLVLLAVQVKNDQNVSMIRSWTATAMSPMLSVLAWARQGGGGFLHNYVLLHDASEENRSLKAQLDAVKVKNIFLENELATAERAKALQFFAAHTPSKTLAASVTGAAAGPDSNAVFVDRGSTSGVLRGMGVVTPDGIVGKVIFVYPTSSMVELVTDEHFGAGVVTQSGTARGVLKGQGKPTCKVDYVPFEDKIAAGDMLFTSGEDHIFPRGFPVGKVKSVNNGQPFKDIVAEPGALVHGLPQDVLIIVEGAHQDIPEAPPSNQAIYINPAPPAASEPAENAAASPAAPVGTEADRMRAQTKALGESQGHTFGGSDGKLPDFNAGKNLPQPPQPQPAAPKPADNSRLKNQAAGVPPPTGGKQN